MEPVHQTGIRWLNLAPRERCAHASLTGARLVKAGYGGEMFGDWIVTNGPTTALVGDGAFWAPLKGMKVQLHRAVA